MKPYMALDCSSSLLGKNWVHWLAWAIELILGNKEFDWGSRWDQIGFIDYVLRLSKRATLKSKPKIKVNFFWKQWKHQSTNLQLLAIWKHGFVRHCQIFHNDLGRNKWIILWYIWQNLSGMVSCWGTRLESRLESKIQGSFIPEFFFSSTQVVVSQMELWSTWKEDNLVSN